MIYKRTYLGWNDPNFEKKKINLHTSIYSENFKKYISFSMRFYY